MDRRTKKAQPSGMEGWFGLGRDSSDNMLIEHPQQYKLDIFSISCSTGSPVGIVRHVS